MGLVWITLIALPGRYGMLGAYDGHVMGNFDDVKEREVRLCNF
jgi:hypothetical protein